MEDIYKKILWEGYGLHYYGGTRTRTGLLCKTDRGLGELKKARVPKEGILFAHDMKKGLRENGFSGICLFFSTVDGQPFYRWDNTCYILEEPLPPQNMEEQKAETFLLGAAALGNMHRCGRGCHSAYAKWNQDRLPVYFAKRHSELAKIRKRIQRSCSYSPMDLIVLKEYSRFMENMEQAQSLLAEAEYGVLVAKTQEAGGFFHDSFKGDHLRMAEDGRVFVGGFEKCSADVPALDLAAYLRRFMRKTEGDRAVLEGMLQAYEAACPLSREERQLVLAMVAFPDRFIKLIHTFYNKRQVCVSPAMQERLEEAVQESMEAQRLLHILQGLWG